MITSPELRSTLFRIGMPPAVAAFKKSNVWPKFSVIYTIAKNINTDDY
jgi:hypothetical protein